MYPSVHHVDDDRSLTQQIADLEQQLDKVGDLLRIERSRRERVDAILSAVLERIPAAVFLKDPLTWQYTVANDLAREVIGPASIGKSDFDVLPSDIAQRLRENDERVIAARQFETTEEQLVDANGDPRIYVTTKFPIVLPTDEVIALGGIAMDITERRRAEAEARRLNSELEQRVAERTHQLEIALQAGKLGTWVWEVQTGVVVWSNDVEEIFGLSRGGFAGTYEAYLELVHPNDLPYLQQTVQRALESGEHYYIEHRIVLPTGEIRWIEGEGEAIFDNGRAVRMTGTVHDITERRRTEETLRRSEQLLRETQQLSHAASWERDLVSGESVWSDEHYRIFGFAPGSVQPTHDVFASRLHPDDRDRVLAAAANAITSGDPYESEYRIVRPDGSERYVYATAVIVCDATGKPARMTGSVLDVTERKLAEQALQRAVAEKEILLREIHHRVKNNLQIISGVLQFQARKVRDPMDLAAFSEGRDRLVAMMLVHEKLYQSRDLARIEFGEYLHSLVDSLRQSFRSDANRIRFRVESDPIRLPIGTALPTGMIVCELVTNIFKYAFPGKRTGEASVEIRAGNGRIRLTVADTGVGLPERFDPAEVVSFGWQLVGNLLLQLDAKLTIERNHGTMIEIVFDEPEESMLPDWKEQR